LNFSIKELEEKLKLYQNFKENKDIYERDLETLRREKEELSRKLIDQQTSSDQNYKRKEEKLIQMHNEEIRRIEIDAENKARNKLSLEEQDLHRDNIRLISDMKLQRKEVEDIKNEKKRILEENRKLRQELEISQAQVKDCAVKQSEMQKTIKMLKEKIKASEAELTQITADFEKEKDNMIEQFNIQFQEKMAEFNNLREQVKIRSKELKNMKGLAQMILDQRSDVEQFFLESLEQIKEEVQKRIIAEGKTKKLPLIGQKGKVYSDKVELSDLDWEDRERVLRLLFSKMNMGVPPANWRTD
jgi:chromosome segregation ATPase